VWELRGAWEVWENSRWGCICIICTYVYMYAYICIYVGGGGGKRGEVEPGGDVAGGALVVA